MLIEDFDNNQRLANIGIRLTEAEAREMIDSIQQLLDDAKNLGRHEHVSSDDYQTEISVWIERGEPTGQPD